MRKSNVLFLCIGNSARSQMAEALLRKHAGDQFDVYSAGMTPSEVNPLALRVLEESDVPTAELRSKGVREFLGRLHCRFLIIVCSDTHDACPTIWPGMAQRLYGPFDDPAATSGSTEERLNKFREVRDQIEAKIVDWLGELREQGALETTAARK